MFGAGIFTMNMERSEVVDFTIPFIENSYSILTSKPKEQTDVFQFVKPFSKNVWLTIIAFGIATCIILISMIRLTKHKPNSDDPIPSSLEIVFDVIAVFSEQGWSIHLYDTRASSN